MYEERERVWVKTGDEICLEDVKKSFILVAVVFLVSLALGFQFSAQHPGFTEKYLEGLKGIFDMIKELNPLLILLIIFFNNAFKSLLAMVGGALLAGVPPVVFAGFNGFILGLVAEMSYSDHGPLFVAAAILPHGIVELPLVLLSSAIGVKLGRNTLNFLLGRQKTLNWNLKKWTSFYLRWIAPLFFLAAIIETFITPLVIGSLR